jgi:16S rRNA C1402 (ribose-2'-O) methylase RsmI
VGVGRPAVAFESPYRIRKSLQLIAESLPARHLTLARELTKLHEEVLRGSAAEVLDALGDRARGEFTLVIEGDQDRPPKTDTPGDGRRRSSSTRGLPDTERL